jgi:uncharacterized protein (DUF433 family)
MKAEDYLEFERFDDKFGPVERIRIKGHRISLEHVLASYNAGMSAETIVREVYPSLTVEEVNAVIAYYVQNKAAVDAYLQRGEALEEAYYQEYLAQESPAVLKKLRALKEEQRGTQTPEHE